MRDLVEAAVKDFNRTIGIGDLPFPDAGVMEFSFNHGGTFYIKITDNGVLFYLLREVADHSIDVTSIKALELCHYNQSRKYDTQCALKDSNQLIFIVFMTAEALNGPEIENILQHLMKLHDTLSPT